MTRGPRLLTPEDFTPEWLIERLGTRVASVRIDDIIWGTATKVLVNVEYDAPTELPSSMCIKGGFDERLVGTGVEGAYVIETNFFRDVAPLVSVPLPRCLHAADGVLILDDLRRDGTTFGEPTEPWTPDRVAVGLEFLASLHRETWGVTSGPIGKLAIGSDDIRVTCRQLLGEEFWSAHFAPLGAGLDLPEFTDRHRIRAGFEALWAYEDALSVTCVNHGDPHIGNAYVDSTGAVSFLDWQCVCRSSPLFDVAYFLTGSLSVEDRRATERALVAEYLRALGSGDGPMLDPDDVWLDYRRYTLHGFLWAITPTVMQSIERVHAMAERYTASIIDNETFAVLGV